MGCMKGNGQSYRTGKTRSVSRMSALPAGP